MPQKVLVTGGAGFIGSHLCERLVKEKFDVRCFDLRKGEVPKVEYIVGDLREEKQVDKAFRDINHVFHFGALVGVENNSMNPFQGLEIELDGIRNALSSAKRNRIRRFVYASSSEVYGNGYGKPFKELDAPMPLSHYAVGKLAAESLCFAFTPRPFHNIILRFFNVYGPRQDSRFVIPRLIEQIKNGLRPTIHYTGNQIRDFTFIDDAVNAIVLSLRTSQVESVFNIGTGIPTRIHNLVKILLRKSNSDVKPEYIHPKERDPRYEVEYRVASINKARHFLGFEPQFSLSKGLDFTLDAI